MIFKKGGKPKKRKGSVTPAVRNDVNNIKLEVKKGTFKVSLNDKLHQTLKYDTEKFASGQVGILFSGSVNGFIRKLEVNGRIDYKKMYTVLTKSKPH